MVENIYSITKYEEITDMTLNQELLRNLKNNPLFQLSTGSKELFHSNFLHWLSIKFPKKFGELFEVLCGENNLGKFEKCKREEYNIDLTLHYENKIIIIENKIKSIPTKEQLDKYVIKISEIYKSYDLVFVFLGLSEPEFFETQKYSTNENNNCNFWKFISYNSLSITMTEIFRHCIIFRIFKLKSLVYINDYIEFINNLSKLEPYFKTNEREEFNFQSDSILEPFKELRIHDLFLKRKFFSIGELIRPKVSENIIWYNSPGWLSENNKWNNTIILKCGFNRGKGTLTMANKISDKWLIGVQLEGDSYRQFLMYSNKINLSEEEQLWIIKIADILKKKNLWFDSVLSANWKLDIKGEGKAKKGYCQYFTKRKDYQELFLHRYVILKNKIVKDVIDTFIKDKDHINKHKDYIKRILQNNSNKTL